jgi:hypothetical protein
MAGFRINAANRGLGSILWLYCITSQLCNHERIAVFRRVGDGKAYGASCPPAGRWTKTPSL